MNKTYNNFIKKTLISIKTLALGIMILFISVATAKAQTCTGTTANIPPNGTITVNGVSVTSASTGYVSQFGAFSGCSGVNLSNNNLYVGATTGIDTGPWQTVLTFSKPVNNIIILLAAAGGNNNEKFYFTSNGGAISISSTNNCYSVINGNSIFSGAGAPPSPGGGGIFQLTSPTSFTTLTMSGLGGMTGSLIGICSASIVECTAGNTAVPLTGTTLNNSANCSATTVNLNSLHTATAPGTSQLVWFTNDTHTGTVYATPTAATVGTYYAYYYDSTNSCYSPASSAVTVTITPCCNAGNTGPNIN
ncbi:hypothetical protein [Chryseobacterium vaccae]|uniref:hypothetical protein n=1 Tax=Chryseobacterium vaccae TaxID=2604424 RepID=UPI001295FAC2|nr:hypothetical protein [Chryseobacterium vaccae]